MAIGTSIPPYFTELALPGAHSDIGGGYYSRWRLANQNSDPALIECFEQERFMSQEETSTPETQSRDFRQALDYAGEKVSLGWVDRICTQPIRTATPQVGAISQIPYAYCAGAERMTLGQKKRSMSTW